MTDIVREWYERAENIDEMKSWNTGALKHWELEAAARFPKGAKILDIGCGMGREAFALAGMGFSVTGIDISAEAITRVRRMEAESGCGIDFLLYDGHTLPFDGERFDVVIIWSQTFGLLYGEEYKKSFLAECRRVLKCGGLLSFSGHDMEYVMATYARYTDGRKFYAYASTEVYWELFLMSELEAYARDAGMTVLSCGRGEVYKVEDGTVLQCLCKKA